MAHRWFPLPLAWLCLIWFGLSNTVFASGLVVCRDGHGGTSIEWGCERNAVGECSSSCADEPEDDPAAPHPCHDTPVQAESQVTKAPPRVSPEIPAPMPVAAPPALPSEPVALVGTGFACAGPQRPPDPLRHLRTIVLLV